MTKPKSNKSHEGSPASPPAGTVKPADPAGSAESAEPSADDEMKRKFREAMDRKNPSAGAERTTHGDKGPAAHGATGGPTQRMFRRKAGG